MRLWPKRKSNLTDLLPPVPDDTEERKAALEEAEQKLSEAQDKLVEVAAQATRYAALAQLLHEEGHVNHYADRLREAYALGAR